MKKLIAFCLAALFLILQIFPGPVGFVSPKIANAASTNPKPTENSVTLYLGYKTYQIQFDNLKSNATLSFKSSSKKVATVNKVGTITPVANGTAVITVTIKQNSKKYTNKIKVTVKNPYIKITSKTNDLNVGSSYTFKATAYGSNSKVTWSVSDKTVAKINSKTGKLTALAEGEVDVIVAAGFITSSCAVIVSKHTFKASKTSITCSKPVSIYITDDYEDDLISYSIDDARIVSCDLNEEQSGKYPFLITPKKIGSTTITLTSKKAANKIKIKVTVNELEVIPTPTVTQTPTSTPTPKPTTKPSPTPTLKPTGIPTPTPTPKVNQVPTVIPVPVTTPTATPAPSVSVIPTSAVTVSPTPTVTPTVAPTTAPTVTPTTAPTATPAAPSVYSISASTTSITLGESDTASIIITDANKGDSIHYSVGDPSLITSWYGPFISLDNSSSGGSITVMPLLSGSTTITVWSDLAPNTIVINVTVTKGPFDFTQIELDI